MWRTRNTTTEKRQSGRQLASATAAVCVTRLRSQTPVPAAVGHCCFAVCLCLSIFFLLFFCHFAILLFSQLLSAHLRCRHCRWISRSRISCANVGRRAAGREPSDVGPTNRPTDRPNELAEDLIPTSRPLCLITFVRACAHRPTRQRKNGRQARAQSLRYPLCLSGGFARACVRRPTSSQQVS